MNSGLRAGGRGRFHPAASAAAGGCLLVSSSLDISGGEEGEIIGI